ncbi:DNA polymerase I [Anaerobium acetethylicum]|uniref:DNA polymerase I n=1 Tax=Anaerobium acetethylicum TaxID=1619234 RepID=A0A1D3TPU2_9FIRM|nr:DNA polymerase I [Anaerobium acetethylicum]SCP95470.1 DNA polymerase I [Anaerobium acetethylicum]
MNDKKIVLIDGNSILNRAFYGLPDLTNSEGLHTNAVFGFLSILFKVLDEEHADHLTVAFDRKEPTFRHEMFGDYKGTRKEMPEELKEQVPVMKEVLKSMNVPVIEKAGYEADDLIGTMAKRAEEEGYQVSVVSGDRDLLQLATDKVKIRIPKTKKGRTEVEDYYAKDVLEAYQVSPVQIIELKALMGDQSDNIPGVPGIGEKTATRIIAEYGSIENAFGNVADIKPNKARESLQNHYDMAQMSKKLATIKTDCEIDYDFQEAEIGNLFTEEAYRQFKRLDFKNFMSRFEVEIPANRVEGYFHKITGFNEVEELFAKALEAETAGFQFVEQGELFGAAIAFGDKDICFVQAQGFVTKEYIIDKIQKILDTVKRASFINLKEALIYISPANEGTLFDAGIAAYLLNPLKNSYEYEDLAKEYLSLLIPSRQDMLGKLSYEKAEEEKPEAFLNCVCYMAYVAYAAAGILEEKLKETGMESLFRTVEMPLVQAIYDMETAGIRVDKEQLKEYGDALQVRIEELEKEIYEAAGEQFNINSPKQLGEILFERLKLPHAKKTKTGYSTAADVLEKLASEHSIVPMILEYRQITKLKSTYADGLANYISEDGRIHGKFNQTITATGRISSTEPNLQNIPIKMELGRLIRKVFIPEQDYVMVDADYSQIELRVLAHLSNDERLIKAYSDAKDIHRITASQVFHTPLDEVTPLQRSNAKAVNFGIVYGISSFGLSQGLSISRKEAGEYINQYFETYPGVKKFLDEAVENAKETGYVTTIFGRRRPVPELKSSNFVQRSFGERVAMNSPIQGAAADIIKIAMVNVNKKIKERKLKSRLILQVHDELLVEAHKDEVDQVREILLSEMSGAADLAVPLEIDMHTGDSWYEAK